MQGNRRAATTSVSVSVVTAAAASAAASAASRASFFLGPAAFSDQPFLAIASDPSVARSRNFAENKTGMTKETRLERIQKPESYTCEREAKSERERESEI